MKLGPSTQTGYAAAWDADTPDGADDHLPEPNVEISTMGTPANPPIFGVPSTPVAGLRGVVNFLTRRGIPGLPLGPNKTAFMGQGMTRLGKAPKGVTVVQQFVPAPSVEQVPDWYQGIADNYLA